MSRIYPNQPLLPSLLDRLLDESASSSSTEPVQRRSQVLRELRQSIRRDLENLLNTRWRCMPSPPELKELDCSLANYGIPDFTGANFGDSDSRENLRSVIENVLQRFEPRFKRVEVVLLENRDPADRKLHFRINALLQAEPDPELIAFDSALEPVTGNFVLTAARHD